MTRPATTDDIIVRTRFVSPTLRSHVVHRPRVDAVLERVVEHLQMLAAYVPYIQANFIMGLDTDEGEEPFALTKEFLQRTPFGRAHVPVRGRDERLFGQRQQHHDDCLVMAVRI